MRARKPIRRPTDASLVTCRIEYEQKETTTTSTAFVTKIPAFDASLERRPLPIPHRIGDDIGSAAARSRHGTAGIIPRGSRMASTRDGYEELTTSNQDRTNGDQARVRGPSLACMELTALSAPFVPPRPPWPSLPPVIPSSTKADGVGKRDGMGGGWPTSIRDDGYPRARECRHNLSWCDSVPFCQPEV